MGSLIDRRQSGLFFCMLAQRAWLDVMLEREVDQADGARWQSTSLLRRGTALCVGGREQSLEQFPVVLISFISRQRCQCPYRLFSRLTRLLFLLKLACKDMEMSLQVADLLLERGMTCIRLLTQQGQLAEKISDDLLLCLQMLLEDLKRITGTRMCCQKGIKTGNGDSAQTSAHMDGLQFASFDEAVGLAHGIANATGSLFDRDAGFP